MDHPEPLSTKQTLQIPQCKKGFTLDEAKNFISNTMDVFHGLEGMQDLRSMYETGKQLSRAYFDCHSYRSELAQHLTLLQYPSFASKMMKKLNNMGVFKNDDIWFSSFYFYNSTWNFSETWPEFATSLALAGLPNLLNLNIGHQPYLENLASKNVYYLIKASLSIIHNIARVPGNVNYFTTDTVKKALFHLSQREEEFLRCVSSLCLAYILADGESGDTPNDTTILQMIINYLQSAMASEKRRAHGFQVTELISALSAYSVSDSTKSSIVSTSINGVPLVSQLKENIMAIQTNHSNFATIREGEESIKTLINLAFDRQLTCKILTHFDTWSMEHHETYPANINRCLDILSNQLNSNNVPNNTSLTGSKSTNIFLSYAIANKQVVLKLAERLKESNINNIESHLNEAITSSEASAVGLSGACTSSQNFDNWLTSIDSTGIGIIFISDIYRLSPACRFESERLINTKKKIILVNIQPKYKPTGWLGKIVENEPIYDFAQKKDIDTVYDRFVVKVEDTVNEIKKLNSDEKRSMVNGVDGQINRPTVGLASVGMSNSEITTQPTNHTATITPHSNSFHNNTTNQMLASYHENEKAPDYSRYLSTDRNCSPQIPAIATSCVTPVASSWRKTIKAEVRQWDSVKVSDWLRSHRLSKLSTNGILDGVLLSQLAGLRLWAPEYFCQCLKNDFGLNVVESLQLFEAFDNLSREPNSNLALPHAVEGTMDENESPHNFEGNFSR